MSDQETIILWRAPNRKCQDPAMELLEGFSPDNYPGPGLFLATFKAVAEEFSACYENGLQEIHLTGPVFQDLVNRGIIKPDCFFPKDQSWHVPEDQLVYFNEVLKLSIVARYIPRNP